MRTLIVLNGECESLEFLKEICEKYDFIICADGGFNHINSIGKKPNLVLGDFDSCIGMPDGDEVIKFPVHKDMTDGEIALWEAIKRQSDEITFTCALGGRKDHEMANLYLLKLARENNAFCNIKESRTDIYYADGTIELFYPVGATLSILPITDIEISLTGFYYKADGLLLKQGSSMGMSNVTVESKTKINILSGNAFVFVNKD